MIWTGLGTEISVGLSTDRTGAGLVLVYEHDG